MTFRFEHANHFSSLDGVGLNINGEGKGETMCNFVKQNNTIPSYRNVFKKDFDIFYGGINLQFTPILDFNHNVFSNFHTNGNV